MYSLFQPVPPLPEGIAATLDLVQQHKHWFSPAPVMLSIHLCLCAQMAPHSSTALKRGRPALTMLFQKPGPTWDSYQTSNVSHLWLLPVPYRARGEPPTSAPKMALYLWNVYFIVRVGSPFAPGLRLSTKHRPVPAHKRPDGPTGHEIRSSCFLGENIFWKHVTSRLRGLLREVRKSVSFHFVFLLGGSRRWSLHGQRPWKATNTKEAVKAGGVGGTRRAELTKGSVNLGWVHSGITRDALWDRGRGCTYSRALVKRLIQSAKCDVSEINTKWLLKLLPQNSDAVTGNPAPLLSSSR